MRPEDGKKVYDQIEIPKELELTVRRSVEEAARRREARRKEEAENSAERDRREEKDLEKRGPERTGLEMESTEKDPLTEKQEEKQGETEGKWGTQSDLPSAPAHCRSRSGSADRVYRRAQHEPGFRRKHEPSSRTGLFGQCSDCALLP